MNLIKEIRPKLDSFDRKRSSLHGQIIQNVSKQSQKIQQSFDYEHQVDLINKKKRNAQK
jgi:hypothetical protein